jgi:hypothetical protein
MMMFIVDGYKLDSQAEMYRLPLWILSTHRLVPVCSFLLSQSLSNPTSFEGLLCNIPAYYLPLTCWVHSGDYFEKMYVNTRRTININPEY